MSDQYNNFVVNVLESAPLKTRTANGKKQAADFKDTIVTSINDDNAPIVVLLQQLSEEDAVTFWVDLVKAKTGNTRESQPCVLPFSHAHRPRPSLGAELPNFHVCRARHEPCHWHSRRLPSFCHRLHGL